MTLIVSPFFEADQLHWCVLMDMLRGCPGEFSSSWENSRRRLKAVPLSEITMVNQQVGTEDLIRRTGC